MYIIKGFALMIEEQFRYDYVTIDYEVELICIYRNKVLRLRPQNETHKPLLPMLL